MSKAVHTDIDKMTTKSYCDENSSSIRQNESSFGTSKKGKQILTHENYLHVCAEIVKKNWSPPDEIRDPSEQIYQEGK